MTDHITEHLPSEAAAASGQGPMLTERAVKRRWFKDKAWLFRNAALLVLILVFAAFLVVGHRRAEKQDQEIDALKGQIGTLQKELKATNVLLESTGNRAASIAYVREMGHRANAILEGLDKRLRENETIARAGAVKAVAALEQLKDHEARVKKLEGQ